MGADAHFSASDRDAALREGNGTDEREGDEACDGCGQFVQCDELVWSTADAGNFCASCREPCLSDGTPIRRRALTREERQQAIVDAGHEDWWTER